MVSLGGQLFCVSLRPWWIKAGKKALWLFVFCSFWVCLFVVLILGPLGGGGVSRYFGAKGPIAEACSTCEKEGRPGVGADLSDSRFIIYIFNMRLGRVGRIKYNTTLEPCMVSFFSNHF